MSIINKNIKYTIAAMLVISAFSGALPSKDFMFGNIEVYAATYEELDTEYAYLKSIYLSDGGINFSKTENSYNVNVKDNVEEILVRATPEDTDYLVDINDASVTDTDNYEKTVKLNKGNNTITIYVEGDDDHNTYTLNIFRGDQTTGLTTSTSATTNETVMNGNTNAKNIEIKNSDKKNNTWKDKNGKIQYIDGTGQALKNQWWFDKSTGANYYLKEDGDRAKGWLQNKNNWYYFNQYGEMKTGWICVDNNWYYLNKGGAMKIGWFEDVDGNWYYLDTTGKMIKDSTIDGFKLGENGVLINSNI